MIDSENAYDKNNVCRLCLSSKGNFRNIFQNAKTVIKIRKCTSLKIKFDDGYTPFICITCMRRLNIAYEFKRKCLQSAATLRTLKSPCTFPKSEYETWSETDEKCARPLYEKNNENQKETSDIADDIKNMANEERAHSNNEDNAKAIPAVDFHIKNDSTSTENINISEIYHKKKTEKTEKCNKCGKRYKSLGYLAHHMEIHKTENSDSAASRKGADSSLKKKKLPFVCSVCGKSFSQAGNLTAHRRSHTGERPFQCDICFKAFTQIGNLHVHKRIHADTREFKCNLCDLTFKLSSHLEQHLKTHSTIKEYQCSLCEKGFHKSSHLLTHMRTHTGEKPFSCEHCGKFFGDSSNLATHIRIHTQTKPFACKYCYKDFTQKISMIRHEKRHSLVERKN